jgi:peroxiredoxin
MVKNVLLLLSLSICQFIYGQTIILHSLNNTKIEERKVRNNKPTVYIFLSPECPLCQSYSLTIRNLFEAYRVKGIQLIGIVPGSDYDAATIKQFMRKYNLPIPIYTDPSFAFTKHLKATITPEAFFVNPNGVVLYSGRIDNWAYELGKKRKVITEKDLQNALEAFTQQQPIKVTQTKAIGCYIE